ncbi:hypothetical protein [Thiolapillus sp.]
MNRILLACLAGSLVLSVAAVPAAQPFNGQCPGQLCAYMRDLGIPGSKIYRKSGKELWACDSSRRKLPQGEPAAASDIQYRVLGAQTQAQKQVLELRMRSYRQPQGVLRAFSHHVDVLLEKTLGTGLTEEMYQAIMAPHAGEWWLNGHLATLRKLRSKGSVYDLRFVLEYGSTRPAPLWFP